MRRKYQCVKWYHCLLSWRGQIRRSIWPSVPLQSYRLPSHKFLIVSKYQKTFSVSTNMCPVNSNVLFRRSERVPTFDQGFFLYLSIAPVVEKVNDETLATISICLKIDDYAEHFDFDCEQGKRSVYQTRVHATLGHPRHLWQKGVTDRRTSSILAKITAVSVILL